MHILRQNPNLTLPGSYQKLKQTPYKTNLAAQSKYIYIYDSRGNKNKKNKTAMIVSQVASEPIRNMNEIEDSNKKIETKYEKR